MAINKSRGLRAPGAFTVPDFSVGAPTVEGTLVTYSQATESISVGANATYNAVTVGNAFGSEGKRQIAIKRFAVNEEYWVVLGETVVKGDALDSLADGTSEAGTGSLVAMSGGSAGQIVPAQLSI